MMSEPAVLPSGESDDEFPWHRFMRDLVHYVYLDLRGEDAETNYPEWAFHIRTSIECQTAYAQELHRQSVADVDPLLMEQSRKLLQQARAISPPVPAPTWVERVLTQGRAWVDDVTAQWRQVQFTFADLRLDPPTSSTAAGLMGDEMPVDAPQGTLQFALPDSGFEVTVIVSPEVVAERYRAEIILTLHERFGDYSGIELYLTWDEATYQATTDAMGRALFTDLPADRLQAMKLLVVFAEERGN